MARRSATRVPSADSGVPSARRFSSAARAWCAGGAPEALTTRHHGTSEPPRDMICPTWRGPPRAGSPAATSRSATTSAIVP
jgi:hypothetical protein